MIVSLTVPKDTGQAEQPEDDEEPNEEGVVETAAAGPGYASICIAPPVQTAECLHEDGVDEEAEAAVASGSAPPRDRTISVGGTIRHNISTAALLTEDQHAELLQWATQQDGPWRQDIHDFPASVIKAGAPSSAQEGTWIGEEPYRPELSGFRCELFRNEYLAWCGTVQLPDSHPDLRKRQLNWRVSSRCMEGSR